MEIIIHRVNKVETLKKIPKEYGVEIDVRGYGDQLLLNHDPIDSPENYDSLEDYLKEYQHGTLIFNMKEAGYEQRVIDLAKQNGVKNYFLLDVEFPYIYQATRNKGMRDIAVRYSEVEPIEMALAQKGLLNWVWVDTNTQLPLEQDSYSQLKGAGFKLCLVCPERWGRPEDILKYKKHMKEQGITLDAVMTALDYVADWL